MSIRKIFLWMAVAMFVTVIQKCQPENEPAAPRKVQFSFNLSNAVPGGRVQGLADATQLLTMLGPPSIEAQQKLIKLRDEFQWVMIPDPWS